MSDKQDLRERCFYFLTLFKAKDMALFEKYTAQLAKITAEESTDFYHFLMGEYKKLLEGPTFVQPQRPVSKVEVPKEVVVKKVELKKKTVKKTAIKKKAVAKKVTVKKKSPKKPGKKVTKEVTKKKVKKR